MKNFTLLSFFVLAAVLTAKAQNNPPVVVDDTIHVYKFDVAITINALSNDYDPDGDDIAIIVTPGALSHTDSTITYEFPYEENWSKEEPEAKFYMISDGIETAYGHVYVIYHNPYYDSLDINMVSARINNTGCHFKNYGYDEVGKYYVPKGSGKSSIFSFGLIAGGMDDDGQLHLAGQRFDYEGKDYCAGPVMDSNYYSPETDSAWNRLWKLNRADIEYHRQHCWTAGYQVNPVIASWPGNGNTTAGQASKLAPFYDYDNNGIYEPLHGDYPLIKGDQCVFFIMNDTRRNHSESGGKKLGIEIHGMAYAYDCDLDSALMYTTFLHYDIYNRSAETYHDTYLGVFTDSDIGYSFDDFLGADVKRGSYISYNGRNIDGSGLPGEYGAFPPAIATNILAGPFMDADNIDNPKYDTSGLQLCDYSLNGANFGDGIIDNERYGMQSLAYSVSCLSGPTCDPGTAAEYYNTIRGLMTTGDTMYYNDTSGAYFRFAFPGLTDPCNWGSNGIQPPGVMTGAGGSGMIFEMGYSSSYNQDYRGIPGMGPFTFHPGQMQQLDIAFVWARQYEDTNAAAVKTILGEWTDRIRTYFTSDSTPCGGSFSGISGKVKALKGIKVFPNPASEKLFVEISSVSSSVRYNIINIMGQKICEGRLDPSKRNIIDLGDVSPGFYILNVKDNNSRFTEKFIKR